MTTPLSRRDFQELAGIRLREADALLAAGMYDGAYYLYGYVIECALKACIARQTRRFEFPEREKVNKSYTHSLIDLMGVADLKVQLEAEFRTDPQFELYWNTVKAWRETRRYGRSRQVETTDLRDAIIDRRHGVLRWLRKFW